MEKMTVFYKKDNGRITNISSGVQNFSIFNGTEREAAIADYNFLVTDEDPQVMNNPRDYIVIDGEIIVK